MNKRFVMIGGNPFRDYNCTTVFTSLSVVDSVDQCRQIGAMVKRNYDKVGGLFLILNRDTGMEVVEDENGNFDLDQVG